MNTGLKCTSRKTFKKAFRLSGNYAKRWLKRPIGTKYSEYLADKFDQATDKMFSLNYTYIEPEKTFTTMP